ncbi:hypothetical protein KR032_010394, partial [Drosophila birchii]
QMVLAIVLRIIIPFKVGSNALNECTKCSAAVVTFYSSVSRTLFILTTLCLISISLAEVTANWISVAYVPFLIYMTRWTYLALFNQWKNVENSYFDFMHDLSNHWWAYFNTNDTYWPNLEKKLQCCGWEGPRSYMEYLQRVPGHCYNPQLITLGCGQIMTDLFGPMPRIGYYIRIGTLGLEICLLFYFGFTVFRKFA